MALPVPMFIGCATDRRFVEPTAVMLTSLEVNGQVPEAAIVVAGFDLTDEDRAKLRIGAGRMAGNLQFLNVTREMLHEVDPDGFTDEYPPSVLGRLFVADHIQTPGGRLLTLDSDMIVNTSVRPLFELDMRGEYFGAIHDPPRKDDPDYFNSGLTLCNVDRYRYFDVARRCMRYIAEHRPHFPDQDALNSVVGNSWFRLHRLWNYFYSGDRDFDLDDYELAKIAHFCGWKPWDHAEHPAAPLYARYLRIYRDRLAQSGHGQAPCGTDFVATCYEVLLGREPESRGVLDDRANQSRADIVRNVLQCEEFAVGVLTPLRSGGRLVNDNTLTMRQRIWASSQLAITHETAMRLMTVHGRRDLIELLFADPLFARACGPLPTFGTPSTIRIEPTFA